MTDKNGLYNEILKHLVATGSFCFVLANVYEEDAFEITDLKSSQDESGVERKEDNKKTCNLEMVKKLATDSQQPSLVVLAECLHLVTMNKELTKFQKSFLKSLMAKSLHRSHASPRVYEAFGVAPNIPIVSEEEAIQVLQKIEESLSFKKQFPGTAKSFSRFYENEIEERIKEESCQVF